MNLPPVLQTALTRRLPDALRLLEQMVGINSFTANPAGVNQLGQFTAAAFAELGFTAEFVPSTNPDFGNHLVLTRRGRSPRTIGLISHLDTVFPPEEEVRHSFRWQPEGDWIFGPGTMDIKGGTVLMWLMLHALRETDPTLFEALTWVALFNSSEESLSPDFGALCLRRLPPDTLAALVFETGVREGDRFQLVTARKGRATFRVEVEGRAAHAGGDHERGANAIVQLAHTVQRIAALTDYARDLTFNVGAIRGGTVINAVPARAEAELEMRAYAPDVFRAGEAALLALQSDVTVRATHDGYPCRVLIRKLSETPPWPRNEKTDTLLRVWQDAADALGLTVEREERGGLSDGNYLWQTIPTLDGLGPHGDNAHCAERSPDGRKQPECVQVSSFVPKAALNILALTRLATP